VRLEPDRLIEPPQLPILCLRFASLIPVPSSIMVERKVIESIGGSEEAFWGSLEDAVVYTKIGLRFKVYVSSVCWTKYRRHPKSCGETAIKFGKVAGIRLSFIKWVQGYLAEQKITDPRVWKAVEAALRPYQHPRLFTLCNKYRAFINRLEGLTIHYGRMILPISVRRWLWAKQEAFRYRSLNPEKGS
jgi:hypothetical protein